MNFTTPIRKTTTRLFTICLVVFSSFSVTTADIIQPGVPILADPQLQVCLDEAVIANGWTTTEEVTSLSCSDRGVVDLGGIDILINLVELDVSNNQIKLLSNLPQLQVLDLSNNRLFDVFPLDQQTGLRELNLSDNTGLNPLQVQTVVYNNPGLTHLGVGGGIAFGDAYWLPPLGTFGEHNLIELDISDTGLSFDELNPVSNYYPNLSVLDASDNQIESIPPLPQLQGKRPANDTC